MLTTLFRKITDAWGKISPREQRLAVIMAVLALLLAVAAMGRSAYEHLIALDNQILQLQDNILTFHREMALKQSVEAQYMKVAAQHSSRWTEAEIHDRLRAEIYRLAQVDPPPLDENGTPVRTTSDSGSLVEIPTLQPGTLNDSGEAYREYQINVNVSSAPLDALLTFLERLQASPQSLRLDIIDIAREPLANVGAARIELTRTVVNGTDEPIKVPQGSQLPPRQERENIRLKEWRCEGAALEELPGDNPAVPRGIMMAADQPGDAIFFKDVFVAGTSYDLFLEAAVSGAATIGIEDVLAKKMLPGAESAKGDGNAYRYHIEFTVPEGTSPTVELRAPVIVAGAPDTKAAVFSLRLKKKAE